MPSELQRVAVQLLGCLDEATRAVGYLHDRAKKSREGAAWIGGTTNNPNARMAAMQLDEAARRCEEAAHHLSTAQLCAREWVEQMVAGVRTADPATGSTVQGPRSSRRALPTERRQAQIDLREETTKPTPDPTVDRELVELSTTVPEDLPRLNAPPTNATIRVDGKFEYDTDEAGRVVKARAVLDLIDLEHPRDSAAQRKLVGKLPGDHAGHIFARIFRGPIGTLNLLPMTGSDVNLSQYKTIENHWRRLIEQGESVEVDVAFKYPDGGHRPDTIRVRYRHAGGVVRVAIDNKPRRGSS